MHPGYRYASDPYQLSANLHFYGTGNAWSPAHVSLNAARDRVFHKLPIAFRIQTVARPVSNTECDVAGWIPESIIVMANRDRGVLLIRSVRVVIVAVVRARKRDCLCVAADRNVGDAAFYPIAACLSALARTAMLVNPASLDSRTRVIQICTVQACGIRV